MARSFKPWRDRSPSQRARLERAGFTAESYARSTPAQRRAAFGHAETPEHPKEAARDTQKYQKYIAKHTKTGGTALSRDELINLAFNHHYNSLGPGATEPIRWSGHNLRTAITSNYNELRVRESLERLTRDELIKVTQASEQQLRDMGRDRAHGGYGLKYHPS